MSWTGSITLSLRRKNNIKRKKRAKGQKKRKKENAITVARKVISRSIII
jgi:hypothetical protein